MANKLTKNEKNQLKNIIPIHLAHSAPYLFKPFIDKLPDCVFEKNIELFRGLSIPTNDIETSPYDQLFALKIGMCEKELSSWTSTVYTAEYFSLGWKDRTFISAILNFTFKRALSLAKLCEYLELDDYYEMIEDESEYITEDPKIDTVDVVRSIKLILGKSDAYKTFDSSKFIQVMKRLQYEEKLPESTHSVTILNPGQENEFIRALGKGHHYVKEGTNEYIKKLIPGTLDADYTVFRMGELKFRDLYLNEKERVALNYSVDGTISDVYTYTKIDDRMILTLSETSLWNDRFSDYLRIKYDYSNKTVNTFLNDKLLNTLEIEANVREKIELGEIVHVAETSLKYEPTDAMIEYRYINHNKGYVESWIK